MNNHDKNIAELNGTLPTIKIGGVNIAAVSMASLSNQMVKDCLLVRRNRSIQPRTVFDANGQGLSIRARNSIFRKALDQGDIIHADGGFLVALSRFKNGPSIPQRTATTDFIWDAAAQAEKLGLSFFLLGGEKGLAERACDRLLKSYPNLKVAGCHHGYFNETDETALIEKINASNADIIWVGLGKPREQQFCIRNKSTLKVGWLVTCGGCFHFITGDYKRAPRWMQKAGIEWIHRMYSRPRELFFRYLITTPHSLFLALTR
ncbi:MAG: WecB/TagA/CpsF family glycosyltransferase [Devosiaceae bacterium]|nr:WecB/TagA/CpsF family glycosyltransferase [Devosiaceae bacterium]